MIIFESFFHPLVHYVFRSNFYLSSKDVVGGDTAATVISGFGNDLFTSGFLIAGNHAVTEVVGHAGDFSPGIVTVIGGLIIRISFFGDIPCAEVVLIG